MAPYGLLFTIVLFVLFAYCSTEQACKDKKSDLKHNWQLRPTKLQLRCILYDLTLKMFMFSPNETEIGDCVFVPEVNCTLASGKSNDTYSIVYKNCTPPELQVEVSGELVTGLEGNWTCRWGVDANSKCRISTTQVIPPKQPQRPQKEAKKEDTNNGKVIATTATVTAFVISGAILMAYIVIRNRKKKQAQQSTSARLTAGMHETAVRKIEEEEQML